jgi:hypothetical protein
MRRRENERGVEDGETGRTRFPLVLINLEQAAWVGVQK